MCVWTFFLYECYGASVTEPFYFSFALFHCASTYSLISVSFPLCHMSLRDVCPSSFFVWGSTPLGTFSWHDVWKDKMKKRGIDYRNTLMKVCILHTWRVSVNVRLLQMREEKKEKEKEKKE